MIHLSHIASLVSCVVILPHYHSLISRFAAVEFQKTPQDLCTVQSVRERGKRRGEQIVLNGPDGRGASSLPFSFFSYPSELRLTSLLLIASFTDSYSYADRRLSLFFFLSLSTLTFTHDENLLFSFL